MGKQQQEDSCVRPLANFPATVWGDDFIFSMENSVPESHIRHIELSKDKVKNMLLNFTSDMVEKVGLIEELCQLGVAYHFESEIEDELNHIWNNQYDLLTSNYFDLYTTALLFRVFRQHGFKLHCGIFNKFMDKNGKLKEKLGSDIKGMLSLYEATYLSFHGEDFLDEVRSFTVSSLESLITTQLKPHLVQHVKNALQCPTHKGVNRMKVRQYISFYEKEEKHNEMILKFAKMDFNMVQSLHRNELCQLLRWWRGSKLVNNLSYARDRIVEGFFWITGLYYEPKYSRGRIINTKAIMLFTLIDDTYDAFGKPNELRLFTEAVRRYDASGINELPNCMKILYKAILDFEDELEEELSKDGRSFGSYYEKEAMKQFIQAYNVEAEWCNKGYVPTFDEYMNIALVTGGVPYFVVSGLLGMEDVAGIKEFQWVQSMPKCVIALQIVTRLCDDLTSIEHEYERDHVATSLKCYMKEHGVSMEKTIQALKTRIEDAWKDMNEACMRPTDVPMPIIMLLLNCSRMIEFVYKYRDSYTYSKTMKNDISFLLWNQIPIQDE